MGGHYYGLRDNLTIVKGRHTIRIGGEVSLDKILHYVNLNNYGVFTFDGSVTGNRFADFLLGRPANFSQQAPVNKVSNGWYTGLFIQDDFRVHPRLSLNFGLRYDLSLPMTDPQNRELTFVPGVRSQLVPTAPLGVLFAGDPGIGRGIAPVDTNNFAPRLGFAWDPFGNSKTSVRGAFGLFYSGLSGNAWNQQMDRQPFTFSNQFFNVKSLTDPYGNETGGSVFPYEFTPARPRFTSNAAIAGVSLDFRTPYDYQMNFSVQRQLGTSWSMSASYVGTIGHKLPIMNEFNYPVYTAGATTATLNARRPYNQGGTLGSIALLQSGLNSAYHSLQMTADKRFSKNFTYRGYYVFAKTLDTLDSEFGQIPGAVSGNGPQNYNKLYLERGRPGQDRRHNFVSSFVWEIDYLHGANAILRGVANGWSLSGIVSFTSGAPLSINSGKDWNADGSNDRADYVGGDITLDPGRSRADVLKRYFNTAAFAQPQAGSEGNAGRGILEGPGYRNVNLAIFRNFKLRERMRLEAKAEANNAFNLVNLGNPDTNLSNVTFGTITGAGGMRNIQVGLRLAF